MKFFKYLIIVMILIILTGCSIDYNLYVTDNYIDENININAEDNSENINDANKKYNPLHYSDDIEYNQTVKRKNGKIIVNLQYRYKFEEFKNANSFNQGFYNRNVSLDNNTININLSDFSGFAPNVNFDIKIKTKNEVIESNADIVKGNTYIWHVDGNNKDKLKIDIKIKRGTAKNISIFEQYSIILCIVGLILLFIIVFSIIFIVKKRKESNKI